MKRHAAGPNIQLRSAPADSPQPSADGNPLVLCPACRRNGQSPAFIRHIRSIGPFDGGLRDVIHSLKFEGRRSLAAHLAPLARDAARDVLRGADAVVPVPLHPWRQWRRGFNQATLTAETLGLPLWPVLSRTRATRAQSELEADARHANVAGAFRLAGWTPGGRGSTAHRVRGRTLVLVDDVLTTGATLEACAQPLLAAGAAEIRALTVARVSRQHTRAISV